MIGTAIKGHAGEHEMLALTVTPQIPQDIISHENTSQALLAAVSAAHKRKDVTSMHHMRY